jgi:hypothetical protein
MHREAMESYEEVKTRFKYNLSHNPSILHDPNLAQLHFMLGIFSLKTDDRDAAFEEYKILKDLNQKKADELFNMIYK